MGFAVVANSQEEGAHQLQKWMTTVVAELAVQFPQQQNKLTQNLGDGVVQPSSDSGLNELQAGHIDRLIAEISKYRTMEQSREHTVKKWLDVDLTSLSFVGVCKLLETMKRDYDAGIQIIDSSEERGEIVQNMPSADQMEAQVKPKKK